MPSEPGRPFTSSFAMALVAVGGAAASLGVLLGWWEAQAYRESDIFGREVVHDGPLLGTEHWTGMAVLLIGVAIALGAVAALALRGGALARGTAVLAVAGGAAIVVLAVLAFTRSAEVVEQVVGPGVEPTWRVGSGLLLTIGGGTLAFGAGVLSLRKA